MKKRFLSSFMVVSLSASTIVGLTPNVVAAPMAGVEYSIDFSTWASGTYTMEQLNSAAAMSGLTFSDYVESVELLKYSVVKDETLGTNVLLLDKTDASAQDGITISVPNELSGKNVTYYIKNRTTSTLASYGVQNKYLNSQKGVVTKGALLGTRVQLNHNNGWIFPDSGFGAGKWIKEEMVVDTDAGKYLYLTDLIGHVSCDDTTEFIANASGNINNVNIYTGKTDHDLYISEIGFRTYPVAMEMGVYNENDENTGTSSASINSSLKFVFDHHMDETTFTTENIKLYNVTDEKYETLSESDIEYDASIFTLKINPQNLSLGKEYRVELTSGIANTDNIALQPTDFSFKTMGCIDYSENCTVFEDDFEGYDIGEYDGSIGEWEISKNNGGKTEIVQLNGNKYFRVSKSASDGTGKCYFTYELDKARSKALWNTVDTVECRIQNENSSKNAVGPFIRSGTDMTSVKANWVNDGSAYVNNDETPLMSYSAGKWYDVKFVMDYSAKVFDAYVDDVPVILNGDFASIHSMDIKTVMFYIEEESSSLLIDDFKITTSNKNMPQAADEVASIEKTVAQGGNAATYIITDDYVETRMSLQPPVIVDSDGYSEENFVIKSDAVARLSEYEQDLTIRADDLRVMVPYAIFNGLNNGKDLSITINKSYDASSVWTKITDKSDLTNTGNAFKLKITSGADEITKLNDKITVTKSGCISGNGSVGIVVVNVDENGSYTPVVSKHDSASNGVMFKTDKCGEFIAVVNNKIFTDVDEDHWAYEFIEAAAARDIIAGNSDGSFAPEEAITRGEAAVIFANSIGLNAVEYNNAFDDMSGNESCAPYVAALYNSGIIDREIWGNNFYPTQKASKTDMAYLAVNTYFYVWGRDNSSLTKFYIEGTYKDIDGLSDDIADYIKSAYVMDFIRGENGYFYPEKGVTRAEASKVAVKLLEALQYSDCGMDLNNKELTDMYTFPLTYKSYYMYISENRLSKLNENGAYGENIKYDSGESNVWYLDEQIKIDDDILPEILRKRYLGNSSENPELVQQLMKAVEWGFLKQKTTGGFNGSPYGFEDDYHSTALFVEEVGRILLLMQESGDSAYAAYLNKYTDKLHNAALWLISDETFLPYYNGGYYDIYTHRYFLYSAGLLYTYKLTGDTALRDKAYTLLKEGISHMTDEGVLPEKGGFDVGYGVVSIHSAARCIFVCDDAMLRSQLRDIVLRGTQYMTNIMDNRGNIDLSTSTRVNGQESNYDGTAKTASERSLYNSLLAASYISEEADLVTAREQMVVRQKYATPAYIQYKDNGYDLSEELFDADDAQRTGNSRRELKNLTVTDYAVSENYGSKSVPGAMFNDGDGSTGWYAKNLPQYVDMDLGSAHEIGKVDIVFGDADEKQYTYSVMISDDGENWTYCAKNITSKDADVNTVQFAYAKGRYVRLWIQKIEPLYQSKWFTDIRSIKIYGTDDENEYDEESGEEYFIDFSTWNTGEYTLEQLNEAAQAFGLTISDAYADDDGMEYTIVYDETIKKNVLKMTYTGNSADGIFLSLPSPTDSNNVTYYINNKTDSTMDSYGINNKYLMASDKTGAVTKGAIMKTKIQLNHDNKWINPDAGYTSNGWIKEELVVNPTLKQYLYLTDKEGHVAYKDSFRLVSSGNQPIYCSKIYMTKSMSEYISEIGFRTYPVVIDSGVYNEDEQYADTTSVSANASLKFVFDHDMDKTTFTADNIQLYNITEGKYESLTPESISYDTESFTLTVSPAGLKKGAEYRVELTNGIKNTDGIKLRDEEISFKVEDGEGDYYFNGFAQIKESAGTMLNAADLDTGNSHVTISPIDETYDGIFEVAENNSNKYIKVAQPGGKNPYGVTLTFDTDLFTALGQRNVVAELDYYIEKTDSSTYAALGRMNNTACLYIRDGKLLQQLNDSNIELKTDVSGRWVHFKWVMNSNGTMNVYADGERLTYNGSYDIPFRAVRNKPTLWQIYLQYANSYNAMDNLRIRNYPEADISFIKEDLSVSNDAQSVPADTDAIYVNFDNIMDEKTLTSNNFKLYKADGTEVASSFVGYDAAEQRIAIVPVAELEASTEYRVFIDESVTNADGKQLRNNTLSFMTSAPRQVQIENVSVTDYNKISVVFDGYTQVEDLTADDISIEGFTVNNVSVKDNTAQITIDGTFNVGDGSITLIGGHDEYGRSLAGLEADYNAEDKIYISSIDFTLESDTSEPKVSVALLGGSAIHDAVIIGAYYNNRLLNNIRFNEYSNIQAGAVTQISAGTLNTSEYTDAADSYVGVMIWNNIKDMKPLCNEIIVTK